MRDCAKECRELYNRAIGRMLKEKQAEGKVLPKEDGWMIRLTDEEIQAVIQSALASEDRELGDYIWQVLLEEIK